MLRINAPQGVSLEYTTQQISAIEQLIQPLRDTGEIASIFAIAGQGGSVQQRLHGADAGALGRARAHAAGDRRPRSPGWLREVPGVRVIPCQPNSLGIRGAGNGLQFALVGNDYDELGDAGARRSSPRWRRTRASTAAPELRRRRSRSSR